jgi:hypothetical protein
VEHHIEGEGVLADIHQKFHFRLSTWRLQCDGLPDLSGIALALRFFLSALDRSSLFVLKPMHW